MRDVRDLAGLTRVLARAVDSVASQLAGRPLRVRADAPPASLLRGRAKALDIELTDVEIGGLVVDHLLVRLVDIDLLPGLPPRVRVPEIQVAATVTQRWVDRWLLREKLPLRMRLDDDGLATAFSLDPLGLGEIETELAVSGGWLQLRPRRAGLLDLPEFAREFFSGYLPLPELPAGARLDGLQHERGELTAHIVLPGFEEALGPGLVSRLRRRMAPGSG